MVIRTFLAIILMRVPRGSVDAENALMRGVSAARLTRAWRAVAAILMVCLLAGGSCEALSQAQHKKRKSGRPKPTPCRSGCVPDTAAVEVIAATADDEAAQRELSLLSRALRNAAPGSYERLSAFAKANAGNVWGARAALALGFDEYNKNHGQQALAWFVKAKPDTLLGDYVLYWTAQAQRLLRRNAEAFTALEAIEREHPSTAMKEQLLEALVPVAIDTHHLDVAVNALESYPVVASKPELLLLRAQAYKVARQTARAAKDYQTLFYKFPLADEAKPEDGKPDLRAAVRAGHLSRRS